MAKPFSEESIEAGRAPALLPWETDPNQHQSQAVGQCQALQALTGARVAHDKLDFDKPLLLADHVAEDQASRERHGFGGIGGGGGHVGEGETNQNAAGGNVDGGGADGGTAVEDEGEQGDWMEKKMREWESDWKDNLCLYEMRLDELREIRMQEEAQQRGLALAAIREKEMDSLDQAESARRAEVEAASGSGVVDVAGKSDASKVERERQREAEMYELWPEVAGVCAKNKHPLDYQVPMERLHALFRDNFWRRLALADDAQFATMLGSIEAKLMEQAPRSVREYIQRVESKLGIFPGLTDEIEGVTTFQTSLPLPLPSVATRRGDLLVPDSFASVPEAVWSCSDGHRLFIRRGNHTWMGAGRGGWSCERPYDLAAVCKEDASLGYRQALNGFVMVPPGPDSLPCMDQWMAEYDDPNVESFCLHVTGERGARLCGRWVLKPNSVGSFSGIEAVYQINETALYEANGDLDELKYLCTIEVRGGPWLMDKCGLRACMAIAVSCARQSLVKIRGCVVGGISHDRKHHSGAGRATMAIDCRDFARVVLQNSTAEMTGWDFMAALRATGKVLVSVIGCKFNRNTHSIGIFDHASVKVSACVMQGNDQGAFIAYERRRPISANPPDELFLSPSLQPDGGPAKRALDGNLRYSTLSLPAGNTGHSTQRTERPSDILAPVGRLRGRGRAQGRCKRSVREGIGLHQYLREETGMDGLQFGTTVRQDPVFGNVTDGWELGLLGWTNGVPPDIIDLVEGICGPDSSSSRIHVEQLPPRSCAHVLFR